MAQSISQRKLEANRRNGPLSGGPRTTAGKARSSRNSLKDGLFARFLILDGAAREDQEAYEKLHRELLNEFQPVEFVDVLNVRRLGDEFWRLNRVIVAEQGAIRQRVDAVSATEDERRRQEFEDDKNIHPAHLKRTSLGLQYLIEELDGFLTEVERLELTGLAPLPLEQLPECLLEDLAPLQQALTAQALEDRKGFAIRTLRQQRARMTRDLGHARQREARELAAKQARFMVPAAKEMDRILRAKSSAERRIDQLLKQLQHLKDARAAADRSATRPSATAS